MLHILIWQMILMSSTGPVACNDTPKGGLSNFTCECSIPSSVVIILRGGHKMFGSVTSVCSRYGALRRIRH